MESIQFRDSVSVSIGFHDTLDETQFIDTLRKIRIVYANTNDTRTNHNLKKALEVYLSATTNTDKNDTFKNFYSALEEAVNSDGSLVTGKDFDNEVRSILADDQLPIDDLREFNNRLKHPDDDAQRKVYEKAISQGTAKVWELRPIVTKVMLCRLSSA